MSGGFTFDPLVSILYTSTDRQDGTPTGATT
jgi:hypothetical protein